MPTDPVLTACFVGREFAPRGSSPLRSRWKLIAFWCRDTYSLKVLTETTKTKAQWTVPLHPLVAELLKTHRHEQLKNQVPGLNLGLVFPSEKGTPRTPNTLQKAFKAIRKATGIDIKIGPQVRRRSMNSNLLRRAVDRLTVRAIMGHTTEEMTARYYGVSEGDKKAAVLSFPVKLR
ncbi:MAG: hypothetical protein EXR77_08700 [Myxococcales bacterium]|nr:hypothetical protein [Myxococcales bacterium]